MGLVPMKPCPQCKKPMKPHCIRATPKNGGPPAKPCGWLTCIYCAITVRNKDGRIMTESTDAK